jgi:hypothetical protein
MTARPSGGGARAHRHGGLATLARESEIGRVCEHQWVAAVLLEHWIEGVEFSKIYHFSLRFNFKRVKNLNLFF